MNENITKESIGDLMVFHGGAGSEHTWSIDSIEPGEDSTKFTLVCEGFEPVIYSFERHGYGDSKLVVRQLLRRAIRKAVSGEA